MSTYIRNLPVALAVVAMLLVIVSCGESTTPEQATAIEIETLPPSDSEGFHAFDEPPVLTAFEKPAYPESARKSGLEGSVMVMLTIGEDGAVEDASILESTDPIFEKPALTAAKLTRFKPAKLEGEPTRCRVAVPYQFKLGG